MKGIILAAGSGTRLYPLTRTISKQLLPVYDKPMIYYPLSTLMEMNIRDILIITTPHDLARFQDLLGNGFNLGINISYKVQLNPNGISEAFIIGEDFIGSDEVTLILGDNIFHGQSSFQESCNSFLDSSATIFVYKVKDPSRYGVAVVDNSNVTIDIIEKPTSYQSNLAVTGLYRYNNDVIEISKALKPSRRGELEITDINKIYLDRGDLITTVLDSGTVWLDAGTFSSLHQASSYVETVQERSGNMIGCIEEVAYRKGFINSNEILQIAYTMNNSYGEYLKTVIGG